MRWLSRRRRTPEPPVTAEETTAARRESEDALAHARAQAGEVRTLARRIRAHREDNHFSELILRTLGEGR